MGLAASQARYLALSARKTNCEYEGQQINQQRLCLSNQSADLFNQMLTLSVPMPPSSTEFTKLQYSWSDGDLTFVLDSYYQLNEPDENYNYVTTSYHYENVYTGQRKYLNDPQVQATKTNHFSEKNVRNYTINTISYNKDKDTYRFDATNALGQEQLLIYQSSNQMKNKDVVELLDYMFETDRIASRNTDAADYTVSPDASTMTYTNGSTTKTYDLVNTETDATGLKNLKQTYGALYDPTKHYYYNSTDKTYICREDIEAVQATSFGEVVVRKQDLNNYYTDGKYYATEKTLRDLEIGDNLAATTAIKEEILEKESLAIYILEFLNNAK